MDYFYTHPSDIKNNSLTIKAEELHHLSKVLRKKVGDEILVVDGNEHAYRVTLKSISRLAAAGEIQEILHRLNEPDIDVKLAFALLKNPSRLDLVIEKCTELGVREFLPMKTERTIASKVNPDRLQKIALAAMKQSGRSFLPPVQRVVGFADVLRTLEHCDAKFIPYEKSSGSLSSHIEKAFTGTVRTVALLVGPEGGFTEEEIQAATGVGFSSVRLGMRRLRSETVAVVAVGACLLGR